MRGTLLAALATALLTCTVQAPAIGQTAAHKTAIEVASVMCGNNGCGTVQTKSQQKRKFQTLGHG